MGKSPHTRYLIDGEIAPYAILNRWGNLWDGDGDREIGSSRQVTPYAILKFDRFL